MTAAPARSNELVGAILSRKYALKRVIGSGSMGTVYKAKSLRDDSWYAIKTVPRKNVINIKTIAEKVEALKQVRHPRVSAMVHVGALGDRVAVFDTCHCRGLAKHAVSTTDNPCRADADRTCRRHGVRQARAGACCVP